MTERNSRLDELTLIESAKAGNGCAFDELLDQHMKLIYALACRLHTSVNLRDELLQAGRIGFMKAVQRYKEEYNTRLISYAVPWIIGEMKRELRLQESSIPYSFDDNCFDSNICVERAHEMESKLARYMDLKTAYTSLEEEDQRILLLRYFRGRTQRDTARILKKSQGQISKAERRILDFLKCQIE